MATMYDLTADYMQVLAMANDPEIPADAIADTLEAIGGEIEQKAESTAVIMKELQAEAEKLKAEEQRLAARRKSVEQNIAAIKERLQTMMQATGKTKFKTTLFSFSIAKNPAKLVVEDESKLPKKYFVPQDPKLDREALRRDLASGAWVEFARLEQGESLRIK